MPASCRDGYASVLLHPEITGADLAEQVRPHRTGAIRRWRRTPLSTARQLAGRTTSHFGSAPCTSIETGCVANSGGLAGRVSAACLYHVGRFLLGGPPFYRPTRLLQTVVCRGGRWLPACGQAAGVSGRAGALGLVRPAPSASDGRRSPARVRLSQRRIARILLTTP
jgi:hypothetical protein